jgi:hypothetical protein
MGKARATLCGVTASVLGLSIWAGPAAFLKPANAQASSEQRAQISVRDVSGSMGTPIPLGIQVQAAVSEGVLATVYIGHLPKGAQLSDGSRTGVTANEQDLIEITGWDLSKTTFSMPSDVTGQFTLSAVVTIENGARPLFTQADFVVDIGQDRTALPSGPVRTVQADVGPYQIAVRTTLERNTAEQVQAEPRDVGPGQKSSPPLPVANAARNQVARDPVAEALAADRKVWLELERTRSETLTRQLIAAHEQIGELRSKIDPPSSDPPELKDAELPRLLSKANELIRPGDVSGARLLLERALETGSAEAAFYLAQTYDPRILVSWNVQGVPPDSEKARALYQRALEAGVSKAKELVELMR